MEVNRRLETMKKSRFVSGLAILAISLFAFLTPSVRAADLPEGDYQSTCMGCMLNGNLLVCTCRDDKGMTHPANLMMTGCNRDVSNKDGKLVCGG